jgi:hypothetical protein
VKVSVSDEGKRIEIRDQLMARLEDVAGALGLRTRRPLRAGFGATMTVGIVEDFRVDEADCEDILARASELIGPLAANVTVPQGAAN